MNASKLFSCWYETKRRAHAFATEEVEYQALRCSLELNILAENHAQLHLMRPQLNQMRDDLQELERMLARSEHADIGAASVSMSGLSFHVREDLPGPRGGT
jgi:hypothetical protein